MMLKRLFLLKTRQRQKLYELFYLLPKNFKDRLIRLQCRRNQRWLKQLNLPSRLIWFVTSSCPGKCGYCFLEKYRNKQKEMSAGAFETVVKSLKCQLSVVTLTGGEPFVRDDFVNLCRILDHYNKALIVSIPTGGFMPKKIEAVLKTILQTTKLSLRVNVSLDGIGCLHDELRGYPGLFASTVETIKRCKELHEKFPRFQELTALTTISAANTEQLPDLIHFVKNDLSVFHKFQFVRSVDGDVFGCDNSYLSDIDCKTIFKPGNMFDIVDLLDTELRRYGTLLGAMKERLILQLIREIVSEKKKILSCVAGRFEGVIFPDGSVSICEFIRPFANLYDYDLNFPDLWRSPAKEELRNHLRNCFCTHPCHLLTAVMFDEKILMRLAEGDKALR